MSDALINILLFVGFIIFVVWSIFHSQKQNQKAKQQIVKLIKQIGGQNIIIEPYHVWGTRGVRHYNVWYVDGNGTRQRRRVSWDLDYWGSLKGASYWDKPLQMPNLVTEPANLSAKEQIVSEMDAEIKRLQKELKLARKED